MLGLSRGTELSENSHSGSKELDPGQASHRTSGPREVLSPRATREMQPVIQKSKMLKARPTTSTSTMTSTCAMEALKPKDRGVQVELKEVEIVKTKDVEVQCTLITDDGLQVYFPN